MTYELALAALADPTRRLLIERMAAGPASVGELARVVPVSRPAVSQHLRVLCDAGLLDVRQEGTRRLYRLAPGGAEALRAWLDRLWTEALDAYAAEAGRQAGGAPATAQGDQAPVAAPSSLDGAAPKPDTHPPASWS